MSIHSPHPTKDQVFSQIGAIHSEKEAIENDMYIV